MEEPHDANQPTPAAPQQTQPITGVQPFPDRLLARFNGVLQVDGYAEFKRLAADRADGSVRLAFCWAHMRRDFFQFHASTKSPLAAELLARVAALYTIEAEIRDHPAEHRRQIRQERSRPIVGAQHGWLHNQLERVSGAPDLAKAMRYAIRHWPDLIAFLDDGRIEMDANVVEHTIRPHTLTRKNALFAGSDGGARHWAIAITLIQMAKLNGVEPMAWIIDVLERIVFGHTKIHELRTLLPWNWQAWNGAAGGDMSAACLGGMIDNPETAKRLIAKLNDALPIPARLTTELQDSLRGQNAGTAISAQGMITWVTYMERDRLQARPRAAPRKGRLHVDHSSALRRPLAVGPRNHRLPEASRQTPPAPAPVAASRGVPSRQ
jgi:hypothetical protein